MIISASYRTDIPAFYGQWFLNRLREGFSYMVNPYGGQVHHVDLRPEAVDGFVFWTRNLRPFFPALEVVAGRGHPFVVQMTVNGYPRVLENAVAPVAHGVEDLRRLHGAYGAKVGVWRYDPILLTSLTPWPWHLDNFAKLAAQLEGLVDEVVISFAHFYRKTLRNVRQALEPEGLTWQDPAPQEKQDMVSQLLPLARRHGMTLSLCAQREFLVEGVQDAVCVDARRLMAVAGQELSVKRFPHRKECGCYQSRDIGDYDTCPHGCVYCYAVQSRPLAQRRHKAHDLHSPFLHPPRSSVQPPPG